MATPDEENVPATEEPSVAPTPYAAPEVPPVDEPPEALDTELEEITDPEPTVLFTPTPIHVDPRYLKRGYGFIPQAPDTRDLHVGITHEQASLVQPAHVDLSHLMPPVLDQGPIGSCTANAIAVAFYCELVKANVPGEKFILSRLALYFEERDMESTPAADLTTVDSGAMIRDGFKVLNRLGAGAEHNYPYNVGNFTQRPPQRYYDNASHRKATQYLAVPQDLNVMRACLAQGYPIVVGFLVFADFESLRVAETGIVELPKPGEATVGGHAVVVIGYDDLSQRFLCRNSWGSHWGMAGDFTIPYEYLLSSFWAFDFWSLRLIQRVG